MLRAQRLDDRGTGGVAVPEDTGGARRIGDMFDQVGRKGLFGLFEIVPVPGHRQPGEFPVTRRRVLATRRFGCGTPAPFRRDTGHSGRPLTGRQFHCMCQTKAVEVGYMKRAGAPFFCPPLRASLHDMAERIGPGIRHAAVEEFACIRRSANADGIHYQQESAGHQPILSNMSGADGDGSGPSSKAASRFCAACSASASFRA